MSHRPNFSPMVSQNHNLDIPAGWLMCPSKGVKTIADRFVVFKTPLRTDINERLSQNARFSPEHMFMYFNELGLKVNLWVDLTQPANRYYNSQIVQKYEIGYKNLDCGINEDLPTREQVHTFIDFMWKAILHEPIGLIAVHSTLGYNRLGFMICSFLIERLNCDLPTAFKTFAAARPPGMYQSSFINELFKRYGGDGDTLLLPPPYPIWAK